MSYLDSYQLHTLPLNTSATPKESTSVLFCKGPEWTRRYQINRESNYLNNRFMYQDQGPPMYRKLGAHYNMYSIPIRTNHSTFAKSFHYEPRQHNAPSYQNDAIAFPPGPPPPQIAMLDAPPESNQDLKHLHIPNIPCNRSLKAYDKYRYLPGPPPDTNVYNGGCHAFGVLPPVNNKACM